MNFNEMKLAIYESYSNGEMSKDAAARLINSFENASIDHELDLALEAVDNAESSFMESAMQYSTGEVAQEVFEAEAKSFGETVKKAWTAFKKWVSEIVSKIGKKISDITAKFTGKEDQKAKVQVPFNLEKMKKFIDDVISHIKPPYDFVDSWWDKLKDKDVPTIISTIGIGGSVAYTVTNRNKLLITIKDSLLKLSTKLTEIEAKGGDTKGIHILRSVVSVANKAVLACAVAIKTKSDGTARMNAIDDLMDANYKNQDSKAADSAYASMDHKLNDAMDQLGELKNKLKEAESNCKEKLAALTNLTPDPNNGIYTNAVKAYGAAMAEHETITKSLPIVKKRVEDLQKGIVDFKNTSDEAASAARAAMTKLTSGLATFGNDAVRTCALDSNILCHSAIKAKKKNDDAYDDIVKLYKERISEAEGLANLTREIVKNTINFYNNMGKFMKGSGFSTKGANTVIKKCQKMLTQIDSYDNQISATKKLAASNGIG